MADGRNVMAIAKIRLEEIARGGRQPVRHAMLFGHLFGHLQHLRPIHRPDPHLRRLFSQRDAPNA